MKVDLSGRVAVVTGGGGVIGTAMCRQLSANGARVAVADRRLDMAQRVADELTASGAEAIALETDVKDRQSAESMIARTVERFGRLDALVNNAGFNGDARQRWPVHEYDDDLWLDIVNTCLTGTYYCSRPAIRQMIAQGNGGAIVNTSSIVGLTPLRLQSAYASAKAGVVNLTRVMALELAQHKIRTNSVAPGSIMNERIRELFYANAEASERMLRHFPLHRAGEPDDIASITCYLLSDDARYITGETVVVDGGWICGFPL